MAQPFEILFLLPFFLLPLTFFLFKVFRSSKITQLPPGPTPWPVIGNIFHMGKMPHITLTNFAKIYGPLMSLRLGTQCLVVGSSSSAAIEILKTHDRILSGRHVPNAMPAKRSDLDKISMGWNSECHNEWRCLRTLCKTELFSGKVLESQAYLREKKVMELVEFLRSKEGQVVNIGELVFATVLNMLSNVLISKDMVNLEKETEDGGIRNLIRGLVEAVSAPNLSDFYPVLGKLDLQGLRKRARYVMTKIRSNWEPILEERRKNKVSGSSSQQDFLEALLDNGLTNDCIHQLFVVCSLS
uniref:Cytochrome P450 n=1 Tax=Solanum tuberosum TaxID=4113 RepID=M1C2U7_SOLTU